MKTKELTGVALDWAVARCEIGEGFRPSDVDDPHFYSTDWAQGGPIIERERIDTAWHIDHWTAMWWADNSGMTKNYAQKFKHNRLHAGPSPLIAAMRCYVAAKLGEEVDIPKELIS